MRDKDLCEIPHYENLLNIKWEKGHSNLHAEEVLYSLFQSLAPSLVTLLTKYQEVFSALPPPHSCKKLVHMGPKLKPGFGRERGCKDDRTLALKNRWRRLSVNFKIALTPVS